MKGADADGDPYGRGGTLIETPMKGADAGGDPYGREGDPDGDHFLSCEYL